MEKQEVSAQLVRSGLVYPQQYFQHPRAFTSARTHSNDSDDVCRSRGRSRRCREVQIRMTDVKRYLRRGDLIILAMLLTIVAVVEYVLLEDILATFFLVTLAFMSTMTAVTINICQDLHNRTRELILRKLSRKG